MVCLQSDLCNLPLLLLPTYKVLISTLFVVSSLLFLVVGWVCFSVIISLVVGWIVVSTAVVCWVVVSIMVVCWIVACVVTTSLGIVSVTDVAV